MTRFGDLFRTLASGQVKFILVGGLAATAHGSPRSTLDVDIVYSRSGPNLVTLVNALAPQHPYLRGALAGLPFHFDLETLKAGLNFTLITDLGAINLFGEIPGGGRYEDLVSHTTEIEAFGIRCLVLDLETLIRVSDSSAALRTSKPSPNWNSSERDPVGNTAVMRDSNHAPK